MSNLALAMAVKKAAQKKKMAKGGSVDDVPEAPSKNAEAMQKGAMSGSLSVKQMLANLKEGIKPEKKMADGGVVAEMDPEKRTGMAYGEEQEKAAQLSGDDEGGESLVGQIMMHPDPKSIAMAVIHKLDMPNRMAQGGEVKKPEDKKDGNWAAPNMDEDKAKSASDSLKKAFGNYAEGGMVTDPEFLSDEEDDSGIWADSNEEDHVEKRKKMLGGIMRSISSSR